MNNPFYPNIMIVFFANCLSTLQNKLHFSQCIKLNTLSTLNNLRKCYIFYGNTEYSDVIDLVTHSLADKSSFTSI